MHEIIGPLVEMQRQDDMAGLLAFTRMTGDLVKAMRACPQPIVAAVDGICAGAGAHLGDGLGFALRNGAKQGRFPVRAGRSCRCRYGRLQYAAEDYWCGPRRRTSLYWPIHGRREAERWGLYNKLCQPEALLADTQSLAGALADGPTFANAMTKRCIHQEWSMGIDD